MILGDHAPASPGPGRVGPGDEAPLQWVIDVCLTCGAHAVFPFRCGHRSLTGPWTVPVAVKATAAGASTWRKLRR